MKKALTLILFICFIAFYTKAQNVTITDDQSYTADTSAMLDVKSTTKGMLVPRLSTTQRNAIFEPATGLLVFDTDLLSFYFYDGVAWINLSAGNASDAWEKSGNNLYTKYANDNLGLGTQSPAHQLHLSRDVSTTDGTDGNFIDIQNSNVSAGVLSGIRFKNGTTSNTFKGGIFYRDASTWGVGEMIFANNPATSAGNVTAQDLRMIIDTKGRIGINKENPLSTLEVKASPDVGSTEPLFQVINQGGDTVFAVYSDGVRINFDESTKGNIGGFAVSGRSATKGERDYFRITTDSTRIYLNESAKGNIGGFAVSGRSATKGPFDEFLRVTPDSTRIYVNENAKGNIGGFAVSGRSATKSSTTKFMDITQENYAIGHESGSNLKTGQYNNFLGYQAGMETTDGSYNTFIGYLSGQNNTTGEYNCFVGWKAGNMADTLFNTFVGHGSGKSTLKGRSNAFFGASSGFNNTTGERNTYLGSGTAVMNETGSYNLYVGTYSGQMSNSGNWNTFVGTFSGASSDGNKNTFVGCYSGSVNNGTNNVFLGYNAGKEETGSNKLIIANGYTDDSTLIYGEFDNSFLRVNGTLNINGSYDLPTNIGTSGQVLVTNGTDAASWASISTGTITADNGVSLSSNQVQLGGDLLKSTYIDHNSYSLFHRLNGTGNFYIYDGTDYAFTVTDDAQGGYVGIGTSSPSSDLHLYQSNDATLKIESNSGIPGIIMDGADAAGTYTMTYQEDGAYKASFGWQATDDYFFVYEGGINSIVSHDGKVGLGTTSPGAKLHIKAPGNSFQDGIRLETSGTTAEDWYLYMNATDDFVFRNDASDYVAFQKNTGNVGIGTTTPDYALQVDGTIAPESSGTDSLGTSSLVWNAIYSSKWNKNSAKYFPKKEAMHILSAHDLKNSSKNEVVVGSFPNQLKNGNHFLIGETAVFNYQVNSYQQEIINQLKKENQLLKEANKKILQRLEGLEKKVSE